MKLQTGPLFLVLIILFSFLVSAANRCLALEDQNQRWSFEFNNTSITDVLKHLSKKTGIQITTNKDIDQMMITRTYQGQSFQQIIKDVFRQTNHVLVWNYSNKKITSVDVWISDGGTNGTLFSQIPSTRKDLSKKKLETNQIYSHGQDESENKEMGHPIPGLPFETGMPEAFFHPEHQE